jgi:hypothetical protein
MFLSDFTLRSKKISINSNFATIKSQINVIEAMLVVTKDGNR